MENEEQIKKENITNDNKNNNNEEITIEITEEKEKEKEEQKSPIEKPTIFKEIEDNNEIKIEELNEKEEKENNIKEKDIENKEEVIEIKQEKDNIEIIEKEEQIKNNEKDDKKEIEDKEKEDDKKEDGNKEIKKIKDKENEEEIIEIKEEKIEEVNKEKKDKKIIKISKTFNNKINKEKKVQFFTPNKNMKQGGSFLDHIEEEKYGLSDKKIEDEIDTHSTNSLNYLDNLFRDVINKYDMENDKIEEPRQFLDKTISHSKTFIEKQIKEEQSFSFSDLINLQLNEVKQNTLSYLDKAKMDLDKRYSLYIKKINEYINENELKISKVLPRFETNENFMNYADDKIFKQIDYLLEIHDNIFSALEDHITLLFTFLDQYSLIQQKNPFEHFLNTNSNEILNCWFLSKINFDKLSLSNIIINKNLSDLVSGYLCKKRENNFAKITIQKDTKGNLSLETDFLRDNINNLKKLKFLGLNSDTVNKILTQLNKRKNEDNEKGLYYPEKIQIGKKLKSLSIIETNLEKQNELPKINLPVLRKVKVKKSLLPLSYFFDSIVAQSSFLKIINLQNCKITDKGFLDFFSYLSQKLYLQESLQYLGFSGNDLTYINLKKFLNKKGTLKNLQYFDLSKNNIYEFVINNFKCLPIIKVLDLSDNNISNYLFFDSIYSRYKKNKMPCLVLLSNNIFISNNKLNNREYRKYIYQCLTTFKYKIKKLNLSLVYNKDNNEDLILLKISPSVKISLIKLNLSFCGLKTETIWKFFQNNYGLLNLVALNLSYNYISNNFFQLCAGQDILLEKLKTIDLSMNQINCKLLNDIIQIEKFINNYQKLKKIKMQENDFMKELFLLYQDNEKEINEIIDRLSKKEIKFYIDMRNFPLVKNRLVEIIILKDKII